MLNLMNLVLFLHNIIMCNVDYVMYLFDMNLVVYLIILKEILEEILENEVIILKIDEFVQIMHANATVIGIKVKKKKKKKNTNVCNTTKEM